MSDFPSRNDLLRYVGLRFFRSPNVLIAPRIDFGAVAVGAKPTLSLKNSHENIQYETREAAINWMACLLHPATYNYVENVKSILLTFYDGRSPLIIRCRYLSIFHGSAESFELTSEPLVEFDEEKRIWGDSKKRVFRGTDPYDTIRRFFEARKPSFMAAVAIDPRP